MEYNICRNCGAKWWGPRQAECPSCGAPRIKDDISVEYDKTPRDPEYKELRK